MNYKEIYGNNVISDMLIYMGGELKSLDQDGRFGGYGVLHTTVKDADLTGDFFSSKSDLDISDGDRRSLYYNHGFDPHIKNNRIGVATFKRDDLGLWVDAQLDARSEYSSAVMDLISKQALGFSSGAVGHLVRRESVGKNKSVAHITHWPLGEISITPCPAEPRTLAVPLKMWAQNLTGKAAKNLDQLQPSSVFVEKFGPVDGWSEKEWWQWLNGSQDDLETLTKSTEETPAAEKKVKAAVSISTPRELEAALRDAGYSVHESKVLVSKFSLRDVESAPEHKSDTFRGDALRELARIELQRIREVGVAL